MAESKTTVRPLPSGAKESRMSFSAASVGDPSVPCNENPVSPPATITETFVSPCSDTPVRGFNRPGGPKAGKQSSTQVVCVCGLLVSSGVYLFIYLFIYWQEWIVVLLGQRMAGQYKRQGGKEERMALERKTDIVHRENHHGMKTLGRTSIG
jgi:hypothetical protein